MTSKTNRIRESENLNKQVLYLHMGNLTVGLTTNLIKQIKEIGH